MTESAEMKTLRQALEAGGAVLKKKFRKVNYKLKGRANLVTEADLESQKTVTGIIAGAFPEDGFYAEEAASGEMPAGRVWIIDPLDGTTNYAHGFPAAGVSIGFSQDGIIKAGGVYDPFREEFFLAEKGKGSYMNGERLRVSGAGSIEKALLVTGFPYDRAERSDYYCRFFSHFMKISHDVRRMGAASLDMCWTAAGRVDGYWEFNLKPWDVAAGKIIIEEAGGKVTDFGGGPWRVDAALGSQTLAANPALHAEMLRHIKELL